MGLVLLVFAARLRLSRAGLMISNPQLTWILQAKLHAAFKLKDVRNPHFLPLVFSWQPTVLLLGLVALTLYRGYVVFSRYGLIFINFCKSLHAFLATLSRFSGLYPLSRNKLLYQKLLRKGRSLRECWLQYFNLGWWSV